MTLLWFDGWLRRHLERHEALGLPKLEEKPEFYAAWQDELGRLRITEQAADCASVRLVSSPKPARWHFAALVKIALEVQPPSAGATTREASKLVSASCGECGGEGVVSVVSELDGTGMAAHCTCPYGRNLLNARKQQGINVLDFADVLSRKRFRVGKDGEPFRYVKHEDFKGTRRRVRC